MATAIDVHGFAGAFALGVVQTGFDLKAKREGPGGFGVEQMEGNRHLLGDFEVQVDEPRNWEPHQADLVFGNPPCSGFSGLSVSIALRDGSRGDWRKASDINHCMADLVNYAAKCNATTVIFESVQMAYSRGLEYMRLLRRALEEQTGFNYSLTHVLQNDLSLGGYSMRKRYFWVASRVEFGVEVPELDYVNNLYDAIGDLEAVPLGGLEGHATLGSQRSKRLAWLAEQVQWLPGEKSGTAFDKLTEPPPEGPWWTSRGTLHRTDSRTSLYAPRRLDYEKPAPVITGYGLDELFHPRLPRTLTHREVARIMGYPDEWLCEPFMRKQSWSNRWGKQIPVTAGRWIATNVMASMNGNPGSIIGEEIGDRERVIDVTAHWKTAA